MYYPNQISNRSGQVVAIGVAGLASAKFSRTGPTGGSRGKEGKGGFDCGKTQMAGRKHAHTHARGSVQTTGKRNDSRQAILESRYGRIGD